MGLIEYREKWTSWDGSENPRESLLSLLPAGPQSHLSTAAEQSLPKGFYASHSLQKKKKRRLDSHLERGGDPKKPDSLLSHIGNYMV